MAKATAVKSPLDTPTLSIWNYYFVKLRFREYVAGGVPKNPDILKLWIKDRVTKDNDIQEIMDSMGCDLAQEVESRSWNGFMTNKDGFLCLRDYQIKAGLKESANLLGLTVKVKGLKNAITNGLYIRPMYIPLGVKEATKHVETAGHVMTAQGPRSIITRCDVVEQATIEFYLKINNKVLSEAMVIDENYLKAIFEHSQESGFGASRSRSMGTYDVLEFEKKDALPPEYRTYL